MDPVNGRNIAGRPSNRHSRDFTAGMNLNGAEGERPANSTLPWAGSIWNNNSIGSNFSSTVRDNSRPRDNNTYMGAAAELIEGKTGSGSLVASSESDTWGYHRSPWRNSAASGVPPVRSSGVSPSRRLSVAQEQSTQHYVDNTPASYFAVARASAIGQGPVAKPSKPLLDPTTRNFTSTRHVDSPMNGFSNFAFGATAEPTSQRPEVPGGPWSDAASLHSPNDDRRSVAASEYFGPTSEAPSRSGSLPSSRHGDPAQYSQTIENYTKYIQAHPRQASSFSHANGRVLQERSGSIQSDSFQMLGRFNLEQDVDQAMHSHRPSVSGTGFPPSFIPPTSDSSYHRDPYADNQAVVRAENGSFAHAGSYTSDGYVSSFNNDHVVQFNPVNFDSRSAPNGASVRQSPFYSHAHTPPVYDHLYPSRGDQTLSDNHSMAVLQGKLQGYQLQQERRNYASPNNLPPQQFHQLALSTHQLRIPYPYAYPMPNGMPNVVHLNGQTPNQLVPVISGMVPMPEPPKGPRDRNPEAQSFMSQLLADFKANKQPNRWSLKDIYSHIVEFSGDQHGSRFIQQKLEQANSDEKDHVFRELQGDSLQLMQDVFGNYVIQKLFEHGDQTQKRILANRMKGHVVHLSTQMYGCRVVQKALEHILTDQQALLVKELEKNVILCVKDQNGNHVIQKAIERVPSEYIQFIIEAFKGKVKDLSLHQYGCRVIQRLLEHGEEPTKRFILQELHDLGLGLLELIDHQYGNYVIQHILLYGTPEDRAHVIAMVRDHIFDLSSHKFSSNVVEHCLINANDAQRRDIMLKTFEKSPQGENGLLTLVKDQFGNYVIQKIMDTISSDDHATFLTALRPALEEAKPDISGKQYIAVEKKMHRFDCDNSVTSPPPTTRGSSISSTNDTSIIPVPALDNDGPTPQSSGLPSANSSTIDDPVHTTILLDKALSIPSVVTIANPS